METKVVKVKKEKQNICPDSGRAICLTCGEKLYHKEKIKEQENNLVNGENLDKIKFPCLCSYRRFGHRYIGLINTYFDESLKYELIHVNNQTKTSSGLSNVAWDWNLK